jgi:hypothetical protein
MPPNVTDPDRCRSMGNLPGEDVLASDRISAFFGLAQRRLISWIGATNYALSTPEATVNAIKDAETLIVLSLGIRVSWNMAVTTQGVVINKNKGGDGGTINLAGKDLLGYYSDTYEKMAREMVSDLLDPAPGSSGAGSSGYVPFSISPADLYEEDQAPDEEDLL